MNTRIAELLDEADFGIEWVEEEVVPEKYAYVLGLDPGGTTGVAMMRVDMEDETVLPELVFLDQVADGLEGFKTYFQSAVLNGKYIIVSEKWKERNIKGADRTPQYIEGAMHMLWGNENINYQYPDVKQLIPDSYLKEQELWTEGHRHQMDALIHVLVFLRNQGHEALIESLAGQRPDEKIQTMPGAGDTPSESEDGEEAGEGEGGTPTLADLLEGIAQQMVKALGEAAEDAGEAMNDLAEAYEAGETYELSDESPEEGFSVTPEVEEGAKFNYGNNPKDYDAKRVEKNGVFAGYAPVETTGTTVLFED